MKETLKHIAINYGLTITTGFISGIATYIAVNLKNLTKKLKQEKNENKQLLVSALEVLNQLIYIIIFTLKQKSVSELKEELEKTKSELSSMATKKSGDEIVVEFIREKVNEQISQEMKELLLKNLGDIDEYIDKQIKLQLKINKIL